MKSNRRSDQILSSLNFTFSVIRSGSDVLPYSTIGFDSDTSHSSTIESSGEIGSVVKVSLLGDRPLTLWITNPNTVFIWIQMSLPVSCRELEYLYQMVSSVSQQGAFLPQLKLRSSFNAYLCPAISQVTCNEIASTQNLPEVSIELLHMCRALISRSTTSFCSGV